MNRTTRLAWVVALPLVCMSFAWGQDAPSSAPYLGPEQFSIQFEGRLRDAMVALESLTGRRVFHRPPPPQEGVAAPVDMERQVTLNYEQATLDRILVSLCEQAGLVYDAVGDARDISLRRGNPQLDPRPIEVVDQFVLRATHVTIVLTTEFGLRWGEPAPREPTMTDRLNIRLEVDARSPEHFARISGLDPTLRGTTDTGLVLVTEPSVARRWPGGLTVSPGSGLLGIASTAILPVPPEGPTMLTSLEGKLKLHSEVKLTEIRLESDSAGQIITQDDVTVTVGQWTQRGPQLILVLQAKHPLPPPDPQQQTPRVGDLHWAVAVGKDGRQTRALRPLRPGVPDREGMYRLQFLFLTADVDHVLLTVAQRGPVDTEVPFVMRNIPLP